MDVTVTNTVGDEMLVLFTASGPGAVPPLTWGWSDGTDETGPDLVQSHRYTDPGLHPVVVSGAQGRRTVVCSPGIDWLAGGSTAVYDPGEHTVAEVLAYLDAHPDQHDAVLAAEAAGKGRTTILNA